MVKMLQLVAREMRLGALGIIEILRPTTNTPMHITRLLITSVRRLVAREVPLNTLFFLPLILVSLIFANIPKVLAHTPEYLTGFQYGLKNNVSGCDVYLKQVRAPGTIRGWNTLTTPQYKVGFQLGKSDSYLGINDVDTACKRYPGDGNWGPNYFCRVGYDSA